MGKQMGWVAQAQQQPKKILISIMPAAANDQVVNLDFKVFFFFFLKCHTIIIIKIYLRNPNHP